MKNKISFEQNKIELLIFNHCYWWKEYWGGGAFLCPGFCGHSKGLLPPQYDPPKFL